MVTVVFIRGDDLLKAPKELMAVIAVKVSKNNRVHYRASPCGK